MTPLECGKVDVPQLREVRCPLTPLAGFLAKPQQPALQLGSNGAPGAFQERGRPDRFT